MTDEPTNPAAEQSQVAPAADAPEQSFDLPEWVNSDPAEWGAAQNQGAAPPPPQYPQGYGQPPYGYVPPQPQPPPQWQPPKYSGDDLLEKSSEVVDQHIRAYMAPLAQALLELRAQAMAPRQPEIHPAYVQERWRDVQNTVSGAMREFSEDPAFRDPKVKERIEGYLQGAMGDAYARARSGDFGGVDALRNPAFLQTVFYYAKAQAGYNKPLAPIDNPQASLQSTRPQPTSRKPKLTEDEIEALRFTGVSEDEYLKAKADADKFGG
jgi:hypothetical protein